MLKMNCCSQRRLRRCPLTGALTSVFVESEVDQAAGFAQVRDGAG